MSEHPAFPSYLQTARLLRGHSQSSLARLIGVTPAAVCRWEAGDRLPTPHVIPLLAKALGVRRASLVNAMYRRPAA